MLLGVWIAISGCTDLQTGTPVDGGAINGAGGNDAGPGREPGAGARDGGAGDGGDGGGDGDGGPDASDSTCSPDGVLRCAAAGSAARERCRDGVWTAGEPCAEGELCDGSSTAEPGRCVSAAEFCQGSADRKVCVDGVMHACNADAISVSQEACESQRHCQAGLEAGACAVCVPGETYRCEGAELEVCNGAGTGFERSETCASAALCNAEARACTADACAADSHSCSAEHVLRACNADRTAFEDVEPCAAGLCDATGGQCDVCTPGDKTCVAGAPTTCNDEGQGYDTGVCAPPRTICAGQGVCVQCTQDGDCTAPAPRCRRNLCNVGSGDCSTAITPGAACTPDGGGAGVCTDGGACVECRGSSDCKSASAPHCNTATNRCVPCLEANHCSTSLTCRSAYCTGSNQCATAITEGQQCNGNDVCNATGACVDCIDDSTCTAAGRRRCDTGSYTCVECTSNGHCTSAGRTRCKTPENKCVECTADAYCTSTGRTRCNTTINECVPCTADSHCGNPVDFACIDNTCTRKARCGNGIIEPQNNEQCDDPARIGQNSCSASCRIAGYYGPCNLANGVLCPAPFNDSQCGELVPNSSRLCLPGCSKTSDCPNLVGWNEVCVFTSCMLDCSGSGACPLGYTCTRTDFGGSVFDLCVIAN